MKSELPIPTSEKDIRRKNFRKSNLKQKQQQQNKYQECKVGLSFNHHKPLY